MLTVASMFVWSMPIDVFAPLKRVSQTDFADMAYEVMRCVFAIHNELGRFFDERIYKHELAHMHPGVELEVPVEVRHRTFCQRYYLDVLVWDAGLFEFKAADRICPKHRAQTLHYLYMSDLEHAKLVNVRPEQIEHEFVNTTLTREDRLNFQVVAEDWVERVPGAADFREIVTALLRDWGTGLEIGLYRDAVVHFFGGEECVCQAVAVRNGSRVLGEHRVHMIAPGTAFMLTALNGPKASFLTHARRLLNHIDLNAVVWADISIKRVVFTTIRRW
jgi:GxxExxY protein